jgi:hypothetical protein
MPTVSFCSHARPRFAAAALLLSCALAPAAAFADTTDCTSINALPITITTPGAYCLAAGLSTAVTTPAIKINSHNVVLDCNENEVSFNGASGGIGVQASGKNDTVIRNCRFIGFNTGMDIISGHRALLRNNHAVGSRSTGIRITGTDNEVSGNVVTGTTGPNAIRVDAWADSSALVRGNTVRQVTPTSGTLATGIRVTGAGRVLLRDNVVREVGTASTSVASAIVVGSDAALTPSPAVVMDGALFKGTGSHSYGVQTLPATSKVVCEDASAYGYTAPANDAFIGCL